MKDRVVEFPNRYRMLPVEGESNVFDLEAVPGTITQEGTFLNANNLLNATTEQAMGLPEDSTVSEAFAHIQINKADAPIVVENAQVLSSAWAQTNTYSDYPFSATAEVTGMTADMIPEVVFSLEDATSGTFAPIVEATTNGVILYASEQVQSTIVLPTIIGWSKNM